MDHFSISNYKIFIENQRSLWDLGLDKALFRYHPRAWLIKEKLLSKIPSKLKLLFPDTAKRIKRSFKLEDNICKLNNKKITQSKRTGKTEIAHLPL